MQKRLWGTCLLFLGLALLASAPLRAQSTNQGKPPIYIYSADWAVPRAQWADMAKLAAQDRPILDKLVANGTLTGYGEYQHLIHQEGEPTHGTWFSATSEGNLLKALEAIYAQPGLVTAPVQAASKHWDQFLTGSIYNSKPGTSSGYLTWSVWQVKDGQGQAYRELTKSVFVPVLEKLLAEGAITSYGTLVEDYHQNKIGLVYEYFTVPDAASLDKANQAFEDLFKNNPAVGNAVRGLVEQKGHRDYLTRLVHMVNK